MKEEDEEGGSRKSISGRCNGALRSSKRLRLSHSRRHAAGPSHGASSSSTTVNLPSISYRGVQVGATDHTDVTVVSDHSTFRDNAATDDGAIEGIGEGNDDGLDLPCDAPDDGVNEEWRQIVDEIVPGAEELVAGSDALDDGVNEEWRQIVDEIVPGAEELVAGSDAPDDGVNEEWRQIVDEIVPGAEELVAGSDAPDNGVNEEWRQIVDEIVPGAEELVAGSDAPPQGHDDDPLSFREDEADGALQGDAPSSSPQQETAVPTVQEEDLEGIPPETSSPNVARPGEIVEAQGIQSAPAVEDEDDDLRVIWEVTVRPGEPMLTASDFAEPSLTADDFDAFAPVAPFGPSAPSEEAGTSNPEQQLDSEGITCPICMEPWTSTGNHRICSLACGHLFGKACIKRWLKMAARKQGKCPQCNKRARVEDLRTLYVPRISVLDEESQHYMEEARSLRTQNEELKNQVASLREELRRTQARLRLARDQRQFSEVLFDASGNPRHRGHDMAVTAHHMHITGHNGPRSAPRRNTPGNTANPEQQSGQSRPSILQFLSMRSTDASRPVPEDQRRSDERRVGMIVDFEQNNAARPPMRSFDSQPLEEGLFTLQFERSLNGAKVFDMDAQSQLLLVSGRPPETYTSSGLTKMSLSALSEGECVNLPEGTGAIRDIRIAPSGTRDPGKLALVASLGRKLSLFSLESNHVVTTYKLPNPSWSCAWDPCDPNRVYTGLQNGTLLTFDMRQPSSPLDTLKSPSSSLIHTLQYVPGNANHEFEGFEGGGLLSASASTFLYWPGIDQPQEKRWVYLPQPGASSVCVSCSHNPAADATVASFRPKPTAPPTDGASSSTQTDLASTQPTPPSRPSIHVPTHFAYTRGRGAWEQEQGAMVGHRSKAVLSRTAIVSEWGEGQGQDSSCLFASGDEASNAVWLWDLATRAVKQTLRPHPCAPVLDIRSACVAAGVDVLGCISETTLQLYRRVSR